MSQYYFSKLKQAISDPKTTVEKFKEIVDETTRFMDVLRVRCASPDPAMHHQAAKELSELKQLLAKLLP